MSFIETERLIMRPWREEDEADRGIDAIYCDPEVRLYTGGVPSPEDRATFVARRLERQATGAPEIGPLFEKSSGDMVGMCGVRTFKDGPELEIGWLLARAHWGKGYATEAARAVLEHWHGERGVRDILCTIELLNARSVAVANRLGFRFDRVLRVYSRDMLLYKSRR